MQIIDLDRLSRRGQWCMLGGSIIVIIATVNFVVMPLMGRQLNTMLYIGALTDALAVSLVALILGFTLMLIGNFAFRKHDDHILPPRPRGQA